MFARVSVEVEPDTLFALMEHLRDQDGAPDLAEVVDTALRDWLSAQQQGASAAPPQQVPRGYQWKSLFLPEGTALRMAFRNNHEFAIVQGEHLIHNGREVSPNQFANSFADSIRNAWRDISILLPGAKQWKLAFKLRRQSLEGEIPVQQANPAENNPATTRARDTTPNAGKHWDQPERRRFRYRLEDAAFD